MPIHYFNPGDGAWHSIENPSAADIAEILIASASNRPCQSCDADCEYSWLDSGVPNITIVHERDCPHAA